MGYFTVVRGNARCPACGREGEFAVQMKFGDHWSVNFAEGQFLKPGDEVPWQNGGTRAAEEQQIREARSTFGHKAPVVLASAWGECSCKEATVFGVMIVDNRITGIVAIGDGMRGEIDGIGNLYIVDAPTESHT